jgi:rod shape-determining protein MreC
MSSSRDDFGIAFRSALLQKGAAQKFSLISLIILATIIFFLDVYSFSFMKQIRSIINDGIYRVSLVVSSPSRMLPNLSNEITSLINTRNENTKLKIEIETYRNKELNVEYLVNQNKNLKEFLESDKTLFDTNVIVAKVLLDKDSPYLQTIIINRGSKAGILKGMPVLDKNFLIGRVVETNYLSSRVLLLNDINSRIPVTLCEENTQAILKGNGGKYPSLEYLPEDYKINEGTTVFTSGKDQIFTSGTPVGVTNIEGGVKLFSEPNQLSIIKINLKSKIKENF